MNHIKKEKLFVKVKAECSNVAYGVRHDKEYPVIHKEKKGKLGTIYRIVNESGVEIGINGEYVNEIWKSEQEKTFMPHYSI